MLKERYPYYLANRPQQPNADLEVLDKYSGKVATRVALPDDQAVEQAISAAAAAEAPMRALRPYQRQQILEHCVARFRERAEELALALCIEAGKPIKDAHGEVTRLVDTFKVAAEETVRIDGQVINLQISERAKGYRGFIKRVPIGACSFISPFNFPLNLVAHKVAPAIAAGCPFVLKPSERTPIGALIIGEVLAETDLPDGAFSILPVTGAHAGPFVQDERLKLLSFTGSQIGWQLKSQAGRKKVVLELGGSAGCIVDADQAARMQFVIDRIITGAYYQSGQSCISVQRIFVHRSLYDDFRSRFVARVKTLKSGDPQRAETFIGPVIDEPAAQRIEQWISAAVKQGAKVLSGGSRQGTMVEACVLENVAHDSTIYRDEVFGPVAMIEAFDSFDAALAAINGSDFGLQAGVFTNDLSHTMQAWDELVQGGVVVGDIPSFRVDNMPYGGVKGSGCGREGIRWAIADMSEERLLVLRDA